MPFIIYLEYRYELMRLLKIKIVRYYKDSLYGIKLIITTKKNNSKNKTLCVMINFLMFTMLGLSSGV